MMKTTHFLIACFGVFAITACSSEPEPVVPDEIQSVALTEIPIVVPVGTHTVRADYPTASGIESMTVNVLPGPAVDGPFAQATVKFFSTKATYVSIFDEKGNPLVENYPVAAQIAATKALGTDFTSLPETVLETFVRKNEGPFSYYYSHGVVMFESDWPMTSDKDRADFNDVVADYSIEGRFLAGDPHAYDARNGGWPERIKVVMHLRAVGSLNVYDLGIILTGLNVDYIDLDRSQADLVTTLGNYDIGTRKGILGSSISYDAGFATRRVQVRMHNINWVNSTSGDKSYIHSKNKRSMSMIGSPDNYYNSTPASLNVEGDLITLTAFVWLKERTGGNAGEILTRAIAAASNTWTQNFFITTPNDTGYDWEDYEIHLPDYAASENYNRYVLPGHSMRGIAKSSASWYATSDGYFWGLKAPVLTRHTWEGKSFFDAYPNYANWVNSGGTLNADWYLAPLNHDCLVDWW